MLGYVGWEYFGTNVVSKHKQSELRHQLITQWKSDQGVGEDPGQEHGTVGTSDGASQGEQAQISHAHLGDAFALLRIPRFGNDYVMPVVKGVDADALASGVGWVTDTARPGQVGNFALAAHRVTHGEPFNDFPDLRVGDKVVVETRTHIYTYVLDENGTDRAVDFTETWVLDPVPGHPNATPTKRLITLVTCSELFHTDNRSVVTGHLASSTRKPA